MTEQGRFDGFRKSTTDLEIETLLSGHCDKHGISSLEAIKMFPILARRQWLKRFLAHTELFKLTLEVPGDIAELGVFRGLGLLTWANLLEAFAIGNRTKVVYGFDNWQGFTDFAPADGAPNESAGKIVGGFNPGGFREELENALKIFDADRFVGWKPRVQLINGPIEDSLPHFLNANPGVRFSLVHFDCDLYRPTKVGLEALWSRVSRGGILLFDEYAIKEWSGETQAVDEFLATHPELRVFTLPWTNAPAGYLLKP